MLNFILVLGIQLAVHSLNFSIIWDYLPFQKRKLKLKWSRCFFFFAWQKLFCGCYRMWLWKHQGGTLPVNCITLWNQGVTLCITLWKSFIDYLLYSEYSDRQVGYQEIILWSFLMKHIVFSWSQVALYLNVGWSPYNCCPDHKGEFQWEIMNGSLWTHPVRNRNQIPNSNVGLFNFF